MDYNLVNVAPNISRIYEIAKVGGFTVKLVTDPNNPNQVNEKDVNLLNSFFGFEKTEGEVDIIAEVCFSPADILATVTTNRSETLQDIDARVAKVDFSETVVNRAIKGATETLLRKAIERLNLGLMDVIKIIDIAEVIAKMSFSKEIKAEHIAEAIQYQSYSYLKSL